MTHYQKLATMTFRIIGVILIIGSFILWILAFLLLPLAFGLFYFLLPYFIMGNILLILSKFLAKFVCFDFDKSDEQ